MRERKDGMYAFLTKDVYLAGTKLGVICANGKEGLDGLVDYLRDLGVYPESIDLERWSEEYRAWQARIE